MSDSAMFASGFEPEDLHAKLAQELHDQLHNAVHTMPVVMEEGDSVFGLEVFNAVVHLLLILLTLYIWLKMLSMVGGLT